MANPAGNSATASLFSSARRPKLCRSGASHRTASVRGFGPSNSNTHSMNRRRSTWMCAIRTQGLPESLGIGRGCGVGQLAEIEMDGVWYRSLQTSMTSAVQGKLLLGQSIDGWTTVTLVDEYWIARDAGDMKLKFAPGKHKIRVKYRLTPTDSSKPPADPVSGPLEIEIVPNAPKPIRPTWPAM